MMRRLAETEVMTMADEIHVEKVEKPDVEELLEFYKRQGHPTTDDRVKLRRMLENTFCFVAASRGGELIGFARGVTDGLIGHLAECKLDPSCQGPACVTKQDGRIEHDSSGVAKEMAEMVIQSLEEYGVERMDVVAYGTEVDFCEDLGFKPMRGVVVMTRDAAAASSVVEEPASAATR